MLHRLRARLDHLCVLVGDAWILSADVRSNVAISLAVAGLIWGGLGLASGPLIAQPDISVSQRAAIENAGKIGRIEAELQSLQGQINRQQAQFDSLLKEVHDSQGSIEKIGYGLFTLLAAHLGVKGLKAKKEKEE